jgi:hypothetical protein
MKKLCFNCQVQESKRAMFKNLNTAMFKNLNTGVSTRWQGFWSIPLYQPKARVLV